MKHLQFRHSQNSSTGYQVTRLNQRRHLVGMRRGYVISICSPVKFLLNINLQQSGRLIKRLAWCCRWKTGFNQEEILLLTISNQLILKESRDEKSSKFAFSGNLTLVSYASKKGELLIRLSSMHMTLQSKRRNASPHIIVHYSSNKGVVNVMDKMATTYTCKQARTATKNPDVILWAACPQ